MAQAHWSLRPPAELPTDSPDQEANSMTQRRLAQAIADKLAAGYELDTQTATQAVMSMPARRWLGMALPGTTKREVISIDRGHLTTRPLIDG
jgi:hypothetical protein